MPRGKRKSSYTLEEQLSMTNEEIANAKALLKDLEGQRRELENAIQAEKLSWLNELIEKSGKSIDEVAALIASN